MGFSGGQADSRENLVQAGVGLAAGDSVRKTRAALQSWSLKYIRNVNSRLKALDEGIMVLQEREDGLDESARRELHALVRRRVQL